MHCSSTGNNIYVSAGQVHFKAPGGFQCEGGSGWSANEEHANGTNTGEAEVEKMFTLNAT